MEETVISKNFIEQIIDKDLEEGKYTKIVTRFPPEPNGYLHIGHAKSILLNSGLAKKYNGQFNLRFDDTNPTKEKTEFVESITKDVEWLGADFRGEIFFASNYFDQMYEAAVKLIKKGKAYVCDLSADEIREYRGTLTEPGKNSPYRDRSIEENLALFEAMKNGEFPDGSKVLRAKIDMSSPNINMRDPVIYRIARMTHHNTGDKWCIYPMYDFAHPIEDAIEGVTHSICTLEFEDHRPLYDWVVNELEYEHPPKQIEFAKLYLTNVITGKRYIKKLVEDGIVDGWDDPRLVTIASLRRRGFTPEALKTFMELIGVSKSQASVDYAYLEYVIREDLKTKVPRMMAVLDPIKLVIDNYPEGETEYFDIENNPDDENAGTRKVSFSRELYIEREDFMEEPPKKYFRLFPGNEVRLKGAYFVKCVGFDKDAEGNIVTIHCTYDPETRSGNGFEGRKVKGTIHWVNAADSYEATVRLYENLVDEEKGKLNEDGSINFNPNSLTVINNARLESCLKDAKIAESFQFIRNGYFTVDSKDSKDGEPVFNRIVSLKSSYKPGANTTK
ncbi:glutaminyl-tRNA synthetase [Eubacterium ruminantium]|uniref:Glutamine--tRNA ligase n=1 Tax=Eubacterium ruminantium TaxID=42322 RepID=A0A1T4PBU3_9FIRM|nr:MULTISPECIES: glutamine--tRNA ligase/YqeY domain fusion protein [Eubacterium]MCR5368812.1 glutamine--tRNA ligase/YqeY domain fusion protein [Eubacterium sp.]SCW58211.1 glutaminyl-tRNA synthetase [Eubacterium ruminantium]SDM99712.1 glutaminyl-tRNA synthetase [Eubacterium ruminantium]SJZ89030.1 glutaminyl-tRNA synthetase [Eubacterium ruminantium]